jgi:hypothetical protein
VTSASGSRGATLTRRHGSSSTRARTVRASPERLARTVTSRPCQPSTRDSDQSDTPRVTTAPRLPSPSLHSMPVLIQVASSVRTKMPAWSNCDEKSKRNETSTAEPGSKGARRACSVSWMNPYEVIRQASLPPTAATRMPCWSMSTRAGSVVHVPSVQAACFTLTPLLDSCRRCSGFWLDARGSRCEYFSTQALVR